MDTDIFKRFQPRMTRIDTDKKSEMRGAPSVVIREIRGHPNLQIVNHDFQPRIN